MSSFVETKKCLQEWVGHFEPKFQGEGVVPGEYFFGFYKTRHILLSSGENCIVLRAVVLTQYRRVTDGRTDGRNCRGYYSACNAARCKNWKLVANACHTRVCHGWVSYTKCYAGLYRLSTFHSVSCGAGVCIRLRAGHPASSTICAPSVRT